MTVPPGACWFCLKVTGAIKAFAFVETPRKLAMLAHDTPECAGKADGLVEMIGDGGEVG